MLGIPPPPPMPMFPPILEGDPADALSAAGLIDVGWECGACGEETEPGL